MSGSWLAYTSKTLMAAEKRCGQKEKKALAIRWACDKFYYFIAGKQITIKTDHRLLLAILRKKKLAKFLTRIQCFKLQMMNYKIMNTPENKLVLTDALLRSPVVGEHTVGKWKESKESKESLLMLEFLDSLQISFKKVSLD